MAKKQLYKEAFTNILTSSSDKADKNTIEKLANDFANQLIDYEKAKPASLISKLASETYKPGTKEDIAGKILDEYVKFTKKNSDNPLINFHIAKYSKDDKALFASPMSKLLGNIQDYTNDILKNYNKKAQDANFADFVKKFTKSRIGGRFWVNAAMTVAVASFCSLIPKIYSRNKEFPGSDGLKDNVQNNNTKVTLNNKGKNESDKKKNKLLLQLGAGALALGAVALGIYKGKNLKALGEKVTKPGFLNKLANELEFDSYNMPVATLGLICFGAVLLPRLICARDKDEFKEIFTRDIISMVALCYGRKALQNISTKFFTKSTGIVLGTKPKGHETASVLKKVFNYIRPESGVNVMSSSQLKAKYIDIEGYKNGIVDFSKFIQESGGSISKLFKQDDTLKGLTKAAYEKSSFANKVGFDSVDDETLAKAFKELQTSNKDALKDIYSFFKNDKNAIVKKARGINSGFDFLTTLLAIPLFLGALLPKFNEKILKDKYLGKDRNKKNRTTDTVELSQKTVSNKTETNQKVQNKKIAPQQMPSISLRQPVFTIEKKPVTTDDAFGMFMDKAS